MEFEFLLIAPVANPKDSMSEDVGVSFFPEEATVDSGDAIPEIYKLKFYKTANTIDYQKIYNPKCSNRA